MAKRNIRISGFGGQGIILCGYLIGRAAALYDNKTAVLTQSYGPEARGGSCSACVVVAEEEIGYPLVKDDADFFIVLSKEGYLKYAQKLNPGALIFIDSDLVSEAVADNRKVFAIPATRFAQEIGKKIVANIVMLGFFAGITEIISQGALEKSISSFVKKDFTEINLKALEKGYAYAREIKGR